MVDTEIICTFVGIIGNFISLGLLACAVPTFSKIAMNNSVRGLKLVYHLAMTLNSLFWVLYGMPFIHRGFIPVLTSNGIILATQLAYLTISLVYANDNKQRMYVGGVFLIELVVFGLAIGLVITQSPTSKTREELAGVELEKTGSVENVQTRNLVGNMLYRLCWTIYASFKYDVVLGAVNFSGFVFGVFYIKVYDVYYKRYAKSGVDKKLETAEVQV
ncbi:hypothetical protein POM88_034461 [Heracleum sosnowskyi]|uniref:Bidirectional sugar transporter SWEET n=1 Tax=Heracleum sosnowskyi TaxID=360622 RepID=A0AAD8HLA2_9APIA|nr:hypothetical protein POM88_034461 [Heracleum sosnowskyi]